MAMTGKTKLMGIIGYPVTHTASPMMHQAAYTFLGCDYAYVPLEVRPEALGAAIAGLRALNFIGANITIPYKESVIPFLDKLDPEAEKIGAVNTIVNQSGCLIGYNTDGAGFLYALEQEGHFNVAGKNIVLLGAGGSARGIGFQLMTQPIQALTIVNRNIEKAKALAMSLKRVSEISICVVSSDDNALQDILSKADLVINTTPLGMAPNEKESPLKNYSGISDKTFCCDIIYKPQKTLFMKESKARGANVLGGAGMLAGQGVLSFALFTGLSVPYSIMRETLR